MEVSASELAVWAHPSVNAGLQGWNGCSPRPLSSKESLVSKSSQHSVRARLASQAKRRMLRGVGSRKPKAAAHEQRSGEICGKPRRIKTVRSSISPQPWRRTKLVRSMNSHLGNSSLGEISTSEPPSICSCKHATPLIVRKDIHQLTQASSEMLRKGACFFTHLSLI